MPQNFAPDMEWLTNSAELLKALAHPIRLCIVQGLLDTHGCNVTHMQQCLQLPQSTVSQHLSRLKSAGIITGERHGLEIRYKIAHPGVAAVIRALQKPNSDHVDNHT